MQQAVNSNSPSSTPLSAHGEALSQRHADLDAKLEAAQNMLQPDTMLIQSLKKQKLAIKDQLAT